MTEIIPEKDSFLNFSYLSSIFYIYILNSNENFKKIKFPENDDKFEKEFEKLNFENYSNYLEYLSYLNDSGEEINKKKIKFIKSVVKMEFNEKKKEKIVFTLCDKMNISIFTNKNKLIKLLSTQIINFVFDIYELISLIIKNMNNNEKEKIQEIIMENLIETSKLKSDKDNLSNQNTLLEEKIKSLKKKINNNKEKNADVLQKKNNDLEKEISKLKETMKLFENKMEKVQNSLIVEKKERDAEIRKANDLLAKQIEDKKKFQSQLENTNDLLAKQIEDKKKLEEQVKNTNDLLAKQIEDKKKLEEEVKKLKKKVQELDKSNDCLFNEMQIIRKKDYTDENYQYMKNLNIKLLDEGIAFNEKKLELYKGENDLDNLKIELMKRDLKIDYLEKLKIVYEKDLQVKDKKIDKLRVEIEGLKNASQ